MDWAKQAAIQEKSAPVDGISLIPDIKENITILRRESYIRANKQGKRRVLALDQLFSCKI